MVKLIVSDMDNTLLKNDKTLPAEIFPLIRRLHRLGIRFAVGSARNYGNLFQIFEQTAPLMGFLCDNGAYGVLEGEPFLNQALRREEVSRLVNFCEQIPRVSVLLCGRDAIYYRKPAPFMMAVSPSDSTDSLIRLVQVENFDQVEGDVFRVGLHDPANPLCHSLPLLQREFGDSMRILATDDESVDIMRPGVDKGSALEALQKMLCITPAETMVFGDYLNDLGMLSRAEYSYAMENALEEVKAQCRYRAKSNEELGVLRAVEAYLSTL